MQVSCRTVLGPGGWGGDWYVWHAPDGLRARAATALGCVQAGAEKLGVIEASYASAIIGVVDRPLFRREGTTQPKGLISTAWASISTEVWIESASWFQTARNSERSSSRRRKCTQRHSCFICPGPPQAGSPSHFFRHALDVGNPRRAQPRGKTVRAGVSRILRREPDHLILKPNFGSHFS